MGLPYAGTLIDRYRWYTDAQVINKWFDQDIEYTDLQLLTFSHVMHRALLQGHDLRDAMVIANHGCVDQVNTRQAAEDANGLVAVLGEDFIHRIFTMSLMDLNDRSPEEVISFTQAVCGKELADDMFSSGWLNHPKTWDDGLWIGLLSIYSLGLLVTMNLIKHPCLASRE